jgi:hypothetical protein
MAQRLLPCSSGGNQMLAILRRYSHFVFGVIQSGLTRAIAAAIASFPFIETGGFIQNWLLSWLISWMTMLPPVLVAAPAIRSPSVLLTREGPAN